jgi:HAD superfamily hydrolase (TIGR01549 family)
MDKIELEKFKGIIFDLDGVIYDITNAIEKAVDDAIEKYELNVKREDVMQEIAHLIEEIQHYPVPKMILNSYDLLKVNFLEDLKYFKKMRIAVFLFNQFNKYRENAGIFDGIDDLISLLSNKVKLAILTNNKSTYAEEVLDKFNLRKYFESETIIGFNDVTEVKPSPEGILKILEIWKLKPSEAIFIGDMTTDILAGKAANVKMICVASGLAQKETLQENKPDILVENTQELINLFKPEF